jgi:hypothetical protein
MPFLPAPRRSGLRGALRGKAPGLVAAVVFRPIAESPGT